ncbi:hypothetical protein MNBD_GAMMA10-164 [hydrothermal vent metagenome]|uniref:Uncharacterized protein n=1 Tax=hydrothermal vent metagenome TaxID=652676 RepID=A0A3B0XT34_9ZZZZ
MGYQEASYSELKSRLSEKKMNILGKLFDAIDASHLNVDEWIEK